MLEDFVARHRHRDAHRVRAALAPPVLLLLAAVAVAAPPVVAAAAPLTAPATDDVDVVAVRDLDGSAAGTIRKPSSKSTSFSRIARPITTFDKFSRDLPSAPRVGVPAV